MMKDRVSDCVPLAMNVRRLSSQLGVDVQRSVQFDVVKGQPAFQIAVKGQRVAD